MPEKPTLLSVIVGISFQKSFRILDCAGQIFDSLLYKSKGFSTAYFPTISYGEFQKMIRNEREGHYLQLLADNVIYRHKIGSEQEEKAAAEVNDVIDRVENSIAPLVINKYDLAIRRLGIVYTVRASKEMLNAFRKQYFKEDVQVSDFRFSISSGTPDGIMKKGTGDYYNKIYDVSQGDVGTISLDFQEYFDPLKPDWLDCKSADFFEQSKKAYREDLLKKLGSSF